MLVVRSLLEEYARYLIELSCKEFVRNIRYLIEVLIYLEYLIE